MYMVVKLLLRKERPRKQIYMGSVWTESLLYCGVCIHNVYMCSCMCVYVQMHAEIRSQLTLSVFILHLMCLRLGLLPNLELADWLACGPPTCPPPVLDHTHCRICVIIRMLGTKSGAHAV